MVSVSKNKKTRKNLEGRPDWYEGTPLAVYMSGASKRLVLLIEVAGVRRLAHMAYWQGNEIIYSHDVALMAVLNRAILEGTVIKFSAYEIKDQKGGYKDKCLILKTPLFWVSQVHVGDIVIDYTQRGR